MKTCEAIRLLTPKCSECSSPMLHFCIERCCRQSALFCRQCQSDMHFLHNIHKLELLFTEEVEMRDDAVHWNSIIEGLGSLITQANQLLRICQELKSQLANLSETAFQKKKEQMTGSSRWYRDLLESVRLSTKEQISLDQAAKRFGEAARSIDIHDESDFSLPQWKECYRFRSEINYTVYQLDTLSTELNHLLHPEQTAKFNRRLAFLTLLAAMPREDKVENLQEILKTKFSKEFVQKYLLQSINAGEVKITEFQPLKITSQLKRLTISIEKLEEQHFFSAGGLFGRRGINFDFVRIREFMAQLPQFKELRHLTIQRKSQWTHDEFIKFFTAQLLSAATQ